MKTYRMAVFYKYTVETPYFDEEFKHLSQEQANTIKARFEKRMADGEYVNCQIVIDEEA